jgi:pSer/pThr/pTyr-binding forkhead associated (FHA) protein
MRLGAISGPHTGRIVEVHGELTVGRDPGCLLRLDDPKVSRRHATLEPSGTGITITDEGSLNGTWVNDDRIAGSRALAAGDRVRIGGSEFIVDDGSGSGGELPVSSTTAADPVDPDEATRTMLVGTGKPSP